MKFGRLIFFSLILLALFVSPKLVKAEGLYVVNSTADSDDIKPGDDICATSTGVCTLRAAMSEANKHSGPDTINFNIPGVGVRTITITKTLPALTDQTGATTINGYSQPGALENTDTYAQKATILVQIAGPGYDKTGVQGIRIGSPNNVVKGLAFYNIFNSINLYSTKAFENRILGNFIGTDSLGITNAGRGISGAYGVRIETGAHHNHIGDGTPAGRNVVSGNGASGVWLVHPNTNYNQITGNIVGLSPLGDRRVRNFQYGIDINSGPSFNVFSKNVVSGNSQVGMEMSHLVPGTNGPTQGNRFENNFIGTDLTGNSAAAYTANGWNGIRIKDGVSEAQVLNNVVGNNRGGINIGYEPGRGWLLVTKTTVSGNRVGLSLNGTSIPNTEFGIAIFGTNSMIGPNNTVANNSGPGIAVNLPQSDFNHIFDNVIYDNAGLGIDHDTNGVSVNDEGDGDSGPNDGLNFPILTQVTTASASGTTCPKCKVQLFVASPDPSGHGEGNLRLKTIFADAAGLFSGAYFKTIASGSAVTATATDPLGNTSEFSLNVLAL